MNWCKPSMAGPKRHIAIQEYGRSNEELIAALRAKGAEVTRVPVYAYELPEDLGPLREAVNPSGT